MLRPNYDELERLKREFQEKMDNAITPDAKQEFEIEILAIEEKQADMMGHANDIGREKDSIIIQNNDYSPMPSIMPKR